MTLSFHTVFTWRDNSCKPTWLWRHIGLNVEDCACATRSRLPGEWFHAGANGRNAFTMYDIRMSFRTGMKMSLRYSNRSELALVWLAPLWDFVLVSCKRIQSHKRELEWTCTEMKVAPVSCKHPLTLGDRVTNSNRNLKPNLNPAPQPYPTQFVHQNIWYRR